MNTVLKRCLRVAGLVWLPALQAGEQPRIFNLQGIEPRDLHVAATRVFLVVTGQPPHVLTFTNFAATPLKHREDPDSNRVQVTYGADVLGLAQVVVNSSPKQKEALTLIRLDFETREQAAAAGGALRPDRATPTPLTKQKVNE